MAHLMEHMLFMGNRRRSELAGTGSLSNAFTDFHHTVYYAQCPTFAPAAEAEAAATKRRPLLPRALRFFRAVLAPGPNGLTSERLDKERAAVLAERRSVDTLDYRLEQRLLSALHHAEPSRSQLTKRFPIGLSEQVADFTLDQLEDFHRRHYRPENAVLYLVGDLSPSSLLATGGEESGQKSRSAVRAAVTKIVSKIMAGGELGEKKKSRAPAAESAFDDDGRPPSIKVRPHAWRWPLSTTTRGSGGPRTATATSIMAVPSRPTAAVLGANASAACRVEAFCHRRLASFTLHSALKRPIRAIRDEGQLREAILEGMALDALQVRLNLNKSVKDDTGASAPTAVHAVAELRDSPREGVAVVALDVTVPKAEAWRAGLRSTVAQIYRMERLGVTEAEFQRSRAHVEQSARASSNRGRMERIPTGAHAQNLMNSIACGHTVVAAEKAYEATARILRELSRADVSRAARRMGALLLAPMRARTQKHPNQSVVRATAVLACGPPVVSRGGRPPEVVKAATAESALARQVRDTLSHCLDVRRQLPTGGVEHINAAAALVPTPGGATVAVPPPACHTNVAFSQEDTGDGGGVTVSSFRLGNGIRVKCVTRPRSQQSDRGRGCLRVVAAGGRAAEDSRSPIANGRHPLGSVALGARTMQEGGAAGKWTRQEVELFCSQHSVGVDVTAGEEFTHVDLTFGDAHLPPAETAALNGIARGEHARYLSGFEAALQVLQLVLTDFKWEVDAFERAKQSLQNDWSSQRHSVEEQLWRQVIRKMAGGANEARFCAPTPDAIDSLALRQVRDALMDQLRPENIEINVAGDLEAHEVQRLVESYLGCVGGPRRQQHRAPSSPKGRTVSATAAAAAETASGEISVQISDDDYLDRTTTDRADRAVAVVAGLAPNRWGVSPPGTDFGTSSDNPAFYAAALPLLSEVVNRRLFSTVREERKLAYDAQCQFSMFERLAGGWFAVTVATAPEKIRRAKQACLDTLRGMARAERGLEITQELVDAARRHILRQHHESMSAVDATDFSSYWVDSVSSVHSPHVPQKNLLAVTDLAAVMKEIRPEHLRRLLDELVSSREMVTAVGRRVGPLQRPS